jgi:hypothetical protein
MIRDIVKHTIDKNLKACGLVVQYMYATAVVYFSLASFRCSLMMNGLGCPLLVTLERETELYLFTGASRRRLHIGQNNNCLVFTVESNDKLIDGQQGF